MSIASPLHTKWYQPNLYPLLQLAGPSSLLHHRSWASDAICNQFHRWANISKRKLQVSASSNEEWVLVASNWNPANNWCHRWVTVLQQSKSNQEFYGSQKIEMFKARSTKAKQTLKPWQEVKYRQSRELKHKKRRKGHNLNASQSTKQITKIKTRHQTCSATSKPKF